MDAAIGWGMASDRAKVLRLAVKLGVTVSGMDNGEVNLEAPAGYWFSGLGIHEIVHAPWDLETMSALWSKALADLQEYAIEPCTVADCEWCADKAQEE